jgi:hypothetical protein
VKPGNSKPSGGTYASAAANDANNQDKIIVPGVSRSGTLPTEGTWASTARTATEKKANSGHQALPILKRVDVAASSESSASPALHGNFKDTGTVKQPTAISDSSRPSAASSGIKKQVQILKRSDAPPMDDTQTPPVQNAPTSSTANKAYNAFITNLDSDYGCDKPHDESWTAEDP